MSLEWSRLQPEPDRWDERAADRYRAIFDAARTLGLKLLVTLNHFTLPQWASAQGGWHAEAMPKLFAEYAERCARALGDGAALWATLNEPSVLAYMGYAGTRWPPGWGKPAAGFSALRHMLEGHARGRRAFKLERPDAEVGLVINAPYFEPARPNDLRDRMVTATQDWGFSGCALHALRTGWMLPPLSTVPSRHPALADSLDFLGLNYYGRYRVRFDPRMPATMFGRHVQHPSIRSDWTDWGEPYPEGLRDQLLRLGELGVPLYVTENGLFDNEDLRRADFIRAHVDAVHQAIERGADVRGYFHWSLIDNFEWAEGWGAHFGLIALDRDTGARTPRPSSEVYADICRANAIE
jgi:beta-glucosidase